MHFILRGLFLLPFLLLSLTAAQARLVGAAGEDDLRFASLLDRAVEKRFILIGEIHPAASHHAFQARLIEALADRGREPQIVLEMVTRAMDEVLDRWIAGELQPEELEPALGWNESGWPDFEIYRPIFDAAKAHGLRMRGAALERDELMKIGTGGRDALSSARTKELLLDRPLEAAGRQTLLRTIVESHCGMVDERSAEPMVLMQSARDGAMARIMIEAGSVGAILIAGDGHVRRDHGVPRFLPADQSLAIGQIESDTAPEPADGAAFDVIRLTPAVDRGDPCARFRKDAAEEAPSESRK
ncbi:ChaN family lipoprotein [Notoacmeibacter ruber]|uniref:Haem-binding uptake Tiki superfamily ChaN domain-containing protein n=1 Tax=Notoacmeibacter ruber TaxID=2670375 RepID=A0A3L7JDG0_9HYPH|nr:ChaN family lipoprotein [Notoacmeibacter ruber]RLQ88510.1 hypothetical protein D8780_10115 [Notoacmeibacter ruber]